MMRLASPTPTPFPEIVVELVEGPDLSWIVPLGAIVAAIITSLVALVSANGQLRATRRSQWWERFTWAAERLLARESDSETEFALRVLTAMIDDPDSQVQDNRIALDLVNHVADNRRRRRAQPSQLRQASRRQS